MNDSPPTHWLRFTYATVVAWLAMLMPAAVCALLAGLAVTPLLFQSAMASSIASAIVIVRAAFEFLCEGDHLHSPR